jgi:CheY-like chemotaxis protein
MSQKLKCIMLIDDDEPTNFLSNMIIEEAGCTEHIQIEDSGERALSYLVNCGKFPYGNKDNPRPDLIFLDINMPAMNGWEFLDKYNLLKKEYRSEIIMIMLTTSLNPDDELQAKNIAGVNDYKLKPLTKEILNEILEKYFADHLHTHPGTGNYVTQKKIIERL